MLWVVSILINKTIIHNMYNIKFQFVKTEIWSKIQMADITQSFIPDGKKKLIKNSKHSRASIF